MRLWHKDLIAVLPRKQLLGQWRECCLIAKNIAEKGTPNHILVNKVLDYPVTHFVYYAHLVKTEMEKRGYKCDFMKFLAWIAATDKVITTTPTYKELFKGWHNDRYFYQCYYNLQEKYDCGGISEAEWQLIVQKALETIFKGV